MSMAVTFLLPRGCPLRVLVEPVIEALMLALLRSMPVPHFDSPCLAVNAR